MKMRERQEVETKITVSIDELQKMLSVGRNTAYKIADAAGATIKIGSRRLYNVAKIQSYMDANTIGTKEERGQQVGDE